MGLYLLFPLPLLPLTTLSDSDFQTGSATHQLHCYLDNHEKFGFNIYSIQSMKRMMFEIYFISHPLSPARGGDTFLGNNRDILLPCQSKF